MEALLSWFRDRMTAIATSALSLLGVLKTKAPSNQASQASGLGTLSAQNHETRPNPLLFGSRRDREKRGCLS